MTKYDILYEALQSQYETGELTLETAEYLNDVAYELYSDEEFTEASRIAKEYNKVQTEYQKQKAKTQKVINQEEKKRGKYQQLAKNSHFTEILNPDSSFKSEYLRRMYENSKKREEEAKKDLKRLKYVSKTRGLNREIAVGDKPNSLAVGRSYAKAIAKGETPKPLNPDKDDVIKSAREAKNKQNTVTLTKGSKKEVMSYTPARERKPDGNLFLQKVAFTTAEEFNNNKKLKGKPYEDKSRPLNPSDKKLKELEKINKKEKEKYKKSLENNYRKSDGTISLADRKYINKEVQKFSDDWWNGANGNPPAWERY